MGLFSIRNNGGITDAIRCDEKDYLVWKWRPDGTSLGESKRENTIRWGSSIRVKEGSVAVFIYSGDYGIVQDYILGPADTIVNTKNLPVIASIVGLAYNGSSPFQAEVYFINLANTIQMKFAVPYFDVFDSELQEYSVPIAVRGSFDFNIEAYPEFIKKHRLDHFSVADLQAQIRDTVSEQVKNVIANAPDTFGVRVIHLEKKIADIKAAIIPSLTEKLFRDYGVTLKDMNLAAIDIDKDSSGYKELQAVTKDLTSAALKKRSKAKVVAESREIKGSQTIGMFEKAASKFVDIKEDQYARRKQAQAEYADVLEDERAGAIGAIGGKFFRGLGNVIHGERKKDTQATPPPIPGSPSYHVAVDGKATGPFDLGTLAQMAQDGQLTRSSLVWKKGMAEWVKADAVDDLKELFEEMPPIPLN